MNYWKKHYAPEARRGARAALARRVARSTSRLDPVAPVAPVAPTNGDELSLRTVYEERAAILEYDGGLTRQEAEHQARVEMYGDNPLPETWPAFPTGWQQ